MDFISFFNRRQKNIALVWSGQAVLVAHVNDAQHVGGIWHRQVASNHLNSMESTHRDDQRTPLDL
jgi:hypothetical protein